jgi:hypothetical protein
LSCYIWFRSQKNVFFLRSQSIQQDEDAEEHSHAGREPSGSQDAQMEKEILNNANINPTQHPSRS